MIIAWKQTLEEENLFGLLLEGVVYRCLACVLGSASWCLKSKKPFAPNISRA